MNSHRDQKVDRFDGSTASFTDINEMDGQLSTSSSPDSEGDDTETLNYPEEMSNSSRLKHESSFYDSLIDELETPSQPTLGPDGNEAPSRLLEILTDQWQDQNVPNYTSAFEIDIPDSELVLGAVSYEDVINQEEEVAEANRRRLEHEAQTYLQRERQLARQGDLIRTRLLQEAHTQRENIQRERREAISWVQAQRKIFRKLFHRAEQTLLDDLRRQEAAVKRACGDLKSSKIPESRKRFRIESKRVPIMLEMRIRELRGVKNKVPRGFYSLVVTLYDRLGGHALQWTRWDLHQSKQEGSLPNLTKPTRHGGRFYHTEIRFNQNIVVVGPPENALKPCHVLVFELFRLGSRNHDEDDSSRSQRRRGALHSGLSYRRKLRMIEDTVVGWGIMPLVTPDIVPLEGRFKTPLVQGELDPTLDKYGDFEKMYYEDLSSWLGNLYFEVRSLPRERRMALVGDSTVKQVEVDENEVKIRSYVDGNLTSVDEHVKSKTFGLRKRISFKLNIKGDSTVKNSLPQSHALSGDEGAQGGSLNEPESTLTKSLNGLFTASPPGHEVQGRHGVDDVASNKALTVDDEEPVPISTDRIFPRESDITDDTEGDDDDTLQFGYEHTLTDVENYMYSVNTAINVETAAHRRFHTRRKLFFLRQELLSDISAHKIRTVEFWRSIIFLVLTLWLRLYVHYLSQWMFLKHKKIAVYDLQVEWMTVLVKYNWRSVATHIEVGVISTGVVGNQCIFVAGAAIAAFSKRFLGHFPVIGYQVLSYVGISSVLDPWLILIVDIAIQNYDCKTYSDICAQSLTDPACTCNNGDAFKLYTRFLVEEGSGVTGIGVTVVLYVGLSCFSLLLVYLFMLHRGRLLDLYGRLHKQEQAFFVPHDGEVSLPELRLICQEAKRWKSASGAQRKVFVREYELRDPTDRTFLEVNIHIAIYTVMIDGTKELHRQFIKSPDGAIIELFGELDNGDESTFMANGRITNCLALLYNILQDQKELAGVSSKDQCAALFDGL